MTCFSPQSQGQRASTRDSLFPSPIKNITLSSRQYHTSQENQLLSYPTWGLETRRKSRTFPELQPGPRDSEEVSLPDLAVGGRCLCDDRAGLGWRHGLLNHNAGVMVGHPGAAKLVSSRPHHGPTNGVMHRDILPREDRRQREKGQKRWMLQSTLKLSKAKMGNLVMSTKYRVMASGKPRVHLSLLQLTATMRWKITIHLKRKAHKKIPGSSLITLPPSQWEVYIRDV